MSITFNKNKKKKNPKRVVIIGSGGFIGSYLEKILIKKKIKLIAIPRKKIDLVNIKSKAKLRNIIKPSDTVVLIAAKAPVKNISMLDYNLKIIINFCEAFKNFNFNHLIYISSDAVYQDSKNRITEDSIVSPDSLHGLMHFNREQILKIFFSNSLCIVRPTLIFGKLDPHDGYGPNKFWRLAKKNEDIKLFGKGEELRDHIWIMDVVNLITNCIFYKTNGTLNAVSGKITSFNEIAKKLKKILNSKSQIKYTKRTAPMPHNGYRAFNNNLIKKIFPFFKINKINFVFKNYKNEKKY